MRSGVHDANASVTRSGPSRRPPSTGANSRPTHRRTPPPARRARGTSGRRRPRPPAGAASAASLPRADRRRGRAPTRPARPLARAAPAGTCPASSADRRRRQRARRGPPRTSRPAWRRRRRSASSGREARGPRLLFQPLDHLHLVAVVVEHVRFEDAGRAGDVDLRQPAADHVQADEEVSSRRAGAARARARSRCRGRPAWSPSAWRRRAGCRARRRARARAAPRTGTRRRTAGCACRPAAPRASTSAPSSSGGRAASPARGSRPVLGSPLRTWNTPKPPDASSGLTTISPPCSARNDRSRVVSRVTMVGGQRSGYSSTASFSFCSRRPRGSLTMVRRAARALEQQRREVIVEVERRVLAHQHGVAALERHGVLRPEQVMIAGRRGGRSRARPAPPGRRARATGDGARRTRCHGRAPGPRA